jgi:glycosyltransferase involved in cell wall biosynthesis
MVTFFRMADLYVSMCEHEGFGKPLIESMYLGLPVLAYAAAAVPSTMGGAGVLFHDKDYESLAEMVDLLVEDLHLRQRIISGQNERVRTFLEPTVRKLWANYLKKLGLL